MMLGALYLAPQPHDILIIGLGGGTLPRTLERLLPRADIDVVEIDPAVVRVAQQYFAFQADAHVHVIVQDGRAYVRRRCAAASATSSSCSMPMSASTFPSTC